MITGLSADRFAEVAETLSKLIHTPEEIAQAAIPLSANAFCGIYFLLEKGEIVYVGQSVNIGARLQQHAGEKVKSYDAFAFLPCSLEMLGGLELAYITKFQPRDNRMHVKRHHRRR